MLGEGRGSGSTESDPSPVSWRQGFLEEVTSEENQVEPGKGGRDGVWPGREIVPSRKDRLPRPEREVK